MHSTSKLILRNMHISHMKILRIYARTLLLNLERLCSLLQHLKGRLWKHHYSNQKYNMNILINYISTVKMEKWRYFCVQMKQNNKKSKKHNNRSLKWKFHHLKWNRNRRMSSNKIARIVITIMRVQIKQEKKMNKWIRLLILHRIMLS